MPRQKEFDEAEVLDQALELFRARGFKHTSFADLVDELGVSRQSLYDTYGDKQTLYQSALKRYLDSGIDRMRRKLADPAPVRTVLAALFEGMIDGQCANGSPGCLMVNSMVELAPHGYSAGIGTNILPVAPKMASRSPTVFLGRKAVHDPRR